MTSMHLKSSATHLTDDQIDDHLIGDLAAEAAAHLSVCDHCLARVAEAEAPLASFREMSLAWGERRSAVLPSPVSPSALSSRRFTRAHWLTGAAGLATAAIVLAVAVPANSRPDAPAAQTATAAQPTALTPAPQPAVAIQTETLAALGHTGIKSVTPVAATAEQIDRDNQMLQAISRELDEPRQADSFGLVAAARNGQ